MFICLLYVSDRKLLNQLQMLQEKKPVFFLNIARFLVNTSTVLNSTE